MNRKNIVKEKIRGNEFFGNLKNLMFLGFWKSSLKLNPHFIMNHKIFIVLNFLCVLLFAGTVSAIPNPASVYCEEVGGTIEINNTPLGEQGLCVINGEKFDEWKFLEGKVGQNYSWCVKNGYRIETVCDGKSPFSSCRAVCVFQNGNKRDMGYLMNLYEEIYGKQIDPDKREINTNPPIITPKFTYGGGGKHIILQAQGNAQANAEGEDGLPDYFDWRNVNGTNFMTIPKDQVGGSCWAYSTVGTVEAKYNIENNISNPSLHLNLSERNLASDNSECGCSFCGDYEGGLKTKAYFYIKKVGITTEQCFPDKDTNPYPLCSERCSNWTKNLYKIKDYKVFSTTNITYIKKMLKEKGPLSVTVSAKWLGNKKDILYCDDNYPNHCMILVGYNDTGQYWILKNSWGTTWGHEGYAYIKYGNGSCGIESNDQEFIYPENVSLVSFSNESNCKNFVTVCKNGTCDSKTIQKAVEVVCSGGKIFINDSSAVFNEEIDIFLKDNITLDCNNATIDGNYAKDVGIGIIAKNVTVKNCIVKNFVYSGIWLYSSSNNIMRNNIMKNNTYNFGIEGSNISHFYQDIDISNLIDDKPIYYWTKNASNSCKNAEINESNNVGFVALVSCDNITVKNLNLTKNFQGILLVNTTNSKILNNTVNNNGEYGIYLSSSSNNTLTNNTVNNNSGSMFRAHGIYLSHSSYNTLTNNTANNNGGSMFSGCGIRLYYSSYNTLTNNTANNNNYHGIWIGHSSYNNLTNNTLNSNGQNGIYLSYNSSNNILTNNIANNNKINGFSMEDHSSNNIITHNTANYNYQIGIRIDHSSYNNLTHNTANNNNNDLHGICLISSSHNILTNNTLNSNGANGIFLLCNSSYNILINNTANNNNYQGILLVSSSYNNLTNNIANNNKINGFSMEDHSSNNILTNNTANNNYIQGIYLYSSLHNILTNNTANNNRHGVVLSSSLHNILTNNTANNNNYQGIWVGYSSYNNLTNNTLNSNGNIGIYLDNSSNNIINTNRLCLNAQYDIYNETNCINNIGDNNTGDTYYNWNDEGTTGFTYSCPKCYVNDAGVCTIKTGQKCTCINRALNDVNCTEVKLNSSVINWTGTCIDNPENFNNKVFDCQGHKIDGDGWGHGIYLCGKSGNTIKNCIITDFDVGILLDSSLYNILTNNTANNNHYQGIWIGSSSYNNLTNNTLNSNGNNGIYLYNSSNNILTNNTANNNKQFHGFSMDHSSNNNITNNIANNNHIQGIYLSSSNNNILTNNTANNNRHGIVLSSSLHNILTNNTANNNHYQGIWIGSSSYNNLTNNTLNSNGNIGIYLYNSSNNILTNNTVNSNNYTGIYIFDNSSFNKILGNKILNNNETGIAISDCDIWGSCYSDGGNSNNLIEGNEILNNKIGIFSNASNSTINNNYVCGNTELDFNSTNWLSSSGDNNTCSNPDEWKDSSTTTGCKNNCSYISEKAKDIFDAVEMLEYLSGQKGLSNPSLYYDLNNDNTINLLDVLTLIDKIGIEG